MAFAGTPISEVIKAVSGIVAVAAAVSVLASIVVQSARRIKEEAKRAVKREEKADAAEKLVLENPQKPTIAWEAARVRLENYVDRNLLQVQSIYTLIVSVMSFGFVMIILGASLAFYYPDKFQASVLSAVSGIVVSFLGGTFLLLYKFIMAQAKEYVTMLERINAVGMSVQILDTLDDGNKDLKHQTIADVAKHLLEMYGGDTGVHPRKPKTKSKSTTA